MRIFSDPNFPRATGGGRVCAPLHAAHLAHGHQAHTPLRGAGQRLQARDSEAGALGAGDACTERTSAGMRHRVSQAGGARGRAAVPVLQARAPAGCGVAGRAQASARTLRHRAAPRAGAAMTGLWGWVPALAWCAPTCRGGVRALRNAVERKGVATRAIHGVNATGNACLRRHCKSVLPPVKLAHHNLSD